MISGAFDNDALIPGCRYGQALSRPRSSMVTRNIRDKTLDNWPKVSSRGRKALGVTGLNANCLGQYRHKLCQQTLTADVGRSHYLKQHLASNRFVKMLCCISFPQCDGCGATPVQAETDAETDAESPDDALAADAVVTGPEL